MIPIDDIIRWSGGWMVDFLVWCWCWATAAGPLDKMPLDELWEYALLCAGMM
jgi:hypothetical protein